MRRSIGMKYVLAVILVASALLGGATSASAQSAGRVEVCKSGPAGTVATFTLTRLPGTPQTFTVPAGLCQPFSFPAGAEVIIDEQPSPGLQVSNIFVDPPSAEITGTRDVPAGLIGVRATGELLSGATRVNFLNTVSAPGTLQVCKEGADLPAGASFPFTASARGATTPFSLTRAQCRAFSFPVGTQVTIDENLPAGFDLFEIAVDPPAAEVGDRRDVVSGVVVATVGSEPVTVTYTNAVASPASGSVRVCKVMADDVPGGSTSTFSATANGVTTPFTVPVNRGCTTSDYPIGTAVVVSESRTSGFAVSQIVVDPPEAEIAGSRNLAAGSIGVTARPGIVTVTYLNTAVPPTTPPPAGTTPTAPPAIVNLVTGRSLVGGHEILNGDGQRTERWRPRELRGGGHQICLID